MAAIPLRASRVDRSYPQPRPAGNDRRRLQAVDDDELLPTGGARNELDVPARHAELRRQQVQQRLIGRTTHGWRGDASAQDSVDDAVDSVGPGSRGQSDGEADVGVSQDSEQAPQDAQHDQDDQRRQVQHPGRRKGAPDRCKQRLRGRDHESPNLAAAGRIEPGQQHSPEHQHPDREQRELDEVGNEDTHGPSLQRSS